MCASKSPIVSASKQLYFNVMIQRFLLNGNEVFSVLTLIFTPCIHVGSVLYKKYVVSQTGALIFVFMWFNDVTFVYITTRA